MTVREFGDLTWRDAQEQLAHNLVVILPVGSTEAHGPHLPLATDVIISVEMSRRAAEKLAARGIEAFVLPPIAYSVTDFSSDFAGTVSIKRETAAALIRDICVSLYSQGARLIAIANSHLEPEHIASINEAIEIVKQETGRPVAFPDKRRRRWAATLTEEFRRGDCHAGSYETSLVMAARPELVREEVRGELERVPISIAEKIRERRAHLHRSRWQPGVLRRSSRGLPRGRRRELRSALGNDCHGRSGSARPSKQTTPLSCQPSVGVAHSFLPAFQSSLQTPNAAASFAQATATQGRIRRPILKTPQAGARKTPAEVHKLFGDAAFLRRNGKAAAHLHVEWGVTVCCWLRMRRVESRPWVTPKEYSMRDS